MLTIDGTYGEGGGQILRSALALSALTGTPFCIERIRGNRRKPGLLRQHLTAVKAMAEVCGARVSGAELGSGELRFEPAAVRHGSYHFAVGTAGSATLVFQTVLPALLMTPGESHLVLEGGTHNPLAPPFEFIAHSFLPLLQRMGGQVRVELVRPGFHPAGGGRMEVHIAGGTPLAALELTARGELRELRIDALVSQLPEHIAERELKVLERALCDFPCVARRASVDSAGPGNIAIVSAECSALTTTFASFGERGVRAEVVAHRLAGRVRKYLTCQAPVEEYLADQLLLPCALAGSGTYHTTHLSSHARTNAEVIALFLPVRADFTDEGPAGTRVQVRKSATA